MKKVVFILLSLLLAITFSINSKRADAESMVVDFVSVPRFNEYVKGDPSFSRIYLTFDGPLFSGDETSKILPGDEVDGITDKIYVNGKSINEHNEVGNNIELRFLNNVNGIDTIEIIYYENSKEKLEFIEKQTSFSIDSGFDTGYATIINGVTLLYNGTSLDIYRDNSVSGLKTLLLRNYKEETQKYLEYEFMDDKKTILEEMIDDGESLIKSGSTCVEITKGGIFTLLEIKEYSDVNRINPIDIIKVEKAYQYPNKDISFRVFVDKKFSDNYYSHVTLDTVTLRTYINDLSKFYNEDIIKKFEKYDVRNNILDYFSINGILLKDIYLNDDLDEPVRVDYEIGNDFSKFYAITFYIDHNSTFSKENLQSLNDLNSISFNKGFRFLEYNTNKNYTYLFDSNSKSWALCSKEYIENILNDYNNFDLSAFTFEYKQKVLDLKEKMEELISESVIDEEKFIEVISFYNYLYNNREYIEYDASLLFKDSEIVKINDSFYLKLNFEALYNNQKVTLNETLFDSSLISFNNTNNHIVIGNNEIISILVSLNDIENENSIKISQNFKLSNQYKLGNDFIYTFTKNDLEKNDKNIEYLINIVGENVEVIGERQGFIGDSLEFTFKASEGYTIINVLIDGSDLGAIESYKFDNLNDNHTIQIITKNNSKKGCKSAISSISILIVLSSFIVLTSKKRKENY